MTLLTFDDSAEFLGEVENIQVVLIGGQALNYWCLRYGQRINLGDWLPTSADVDFQGGREEAIACATKLGGIPRLATFDDMPGHVAVIVVPRREGDDVTIDFLDRPYGFTTARVVFDAAPRVPVPAISGGTVMLRIMHPIHCLKSRLHNVIGLPGRYDNPHGLNQLRASVQCARESIVEQLEEQKIRPAIDACKRVFDLAMHDRGLDVFHLRGIDIFEALPLHQLLPELFHAEHYPRMVQRLEGKRARRRKLLDTQARLRP